MSNVVLLAERPLTTMVGALRNGDMTTMRRGWYQYTAMAETFGKGLKYMGETFRRSGIDPTYAGVAGRDDLIRKNEKLR